jgi:hypothetical protein
LQERHHRKREARIGEYNQKAPLLAGFSIAIDTYARARVNSVISPLRKSTLVSARVDTPRIFQKEESASGTDETKATP